MANAIPNFSPNAIEQVARILGEVVKGDEIQPFLCQCRIVEAEAESNTKWRRLRSTFLSQQNKDKYANAICRFIMLVMDPIRFVGRPDEFEHSRSALNVTLAFSGLSLNKEGKLERIAPVCTLSEAEERANTIRHKLQGRNIHYEVLKYCRS